MKICLSIMIFLLLACAQIAHDEYDKSLTILQEVWKVKDINYAEKKIKDLRLIESDEEHLTFGVPNKDNVSSIRIHINKKDSKIDGILLWLNHPTKCTEEYIKSQIQTNDWKTYEHPVKQHPIRIEIAEFSASKGVSFLYDKLDPKKEARILYWGADPKKINW